MLKGKSMDSIIDSDDKIFKKNDYEDYESSEDIRNLVPKKYIDFVKAINELGGKLLYVKSGLQVILSGVYPPPNKLNKSNYAVKIVAYQRKKDMVMYIIQLD